MQQKEIVEYNQCNQLSIEFSVLHNDIISPIIGPPSWVFYATKPAGMMYIIDRLLASRLLGLKES